VRLLARSDAPVDSGHQMDADRSLAALTVAAGARGARYVGGVTLRSLPPSPSLGLWGGGGLRSPATDATKWALRICTYFCTVTGEDVAHPAAQRYHARWRTDP
jgi:hypothetical protein